MAMRSQVYEWDLFRGSTTAERTITFAKPFSCMLEKGNTVPSTPVTTATQFIVVDAFGCTPSVFYPGNSSYGAWTNPAGAGAGSTYRGKTAYTTSVFGPRAYLQFVINTTGYFKDPDGVPRDGIPGTAAPYPLSTWFTECRKRKQIPVYILPGQAWDLRMVCYNDWNYSAGPFVDERAATAEGQVQAFFKYTLYDGPDAIIAVKLLEAGINVTPENVDQFKRNLYESSITPTSEA